MGRNSRATDVPALLELGPSTWRILIKMLAAREPIGARELARRLDISSHTVVLYHLEKLQAYHFVEKTSDGNYRVRPDANLGFLDNFLYVKFKVIPRVLVYAVLITGLVVYYAALVGFDYSVHGVFALTIGIISMVFFWTEVYRIWSGLT